MLKLILSLFIALNVMAATTINGIAILVKDQPITLYDIQTEMDKKHLSLDNTVKKLIRHKLQEIEVKERHLHVSSQEVYEEIEKMAEQNKLTIMQLYDVIFKERKLSEKEFKEELKNNMLNKKLFNAIAFSHMEQPTPDEEEEYYRLHIDDFTHPESFTVGIYSAASKERLQEKMDNPMFHAPDVKYESNTLVYDAINPRLAEMLNKTEVHRFTPMIPAPNGKHMSFYVEEKNNVAVQPLEEVRTQIANMIMGENREQVLGDYFDRLRLNADIKIIRMPEAKKKVAEKPSFESWMK